MQNGWALAIAYPADAEVMAGLVDLSHRPKALVCGPAVESLTALEPGQAEWSDGAYVCCRKPGERIVFDLTANTRPAWPNAYYTDLTDAWGLVGLIGPRSIEVLRRLIPIDFEPPGVRKTLYAVVRCHGIWVQLINPAASQPGVLLACDRSHSQNLVDGLFRHGANLGLKSAGLRLFEEWMGRVAA